MYYALLYDTVPDFVRLREPFRAEHLALAESARRTGLLVLAGAFDPPDSALLVFKAEDPAPVLEFARNDPYVRNGLVTSWRARPWKVVVGA